jgi:hypothetical protein
VDVVGCQVTFSSSSVALPKVLHSGKRAFAEWRYLPSARHSAALGEASLPRVEFFPSVTLGEDWLPGVSDFWLSGKPTSPVVDSSDEIE